MKNQGRGALDEKRRSDREHRRQVGLPKHVWGMSDKQFAMWRKKRAAAMWETDEEANAFWAFVDQGFREFMAEAEAVGPRPDWMPSAKDSPEERRAPRRYTAWARFEPRRTSSSSLKTASNPAGHAAPSARRSRSPRSAGA